MCTGGFPLDVEFSATRLRELCKMDGAVVLTTDGDAHRAGATHLMPDPAIPTEESGTRHRTAQRVARADRLPGHLGVAVDADHQPLPRRRGATCWRQLGELLSRANQAIATLERYKSRLDEVSNTLSALEIEDLVTVRDAASSRSGWRWCAASPTRSPATSSSSAPTAGCWPCSSRS